MDMKKAQTWMNVICCGIFSILTMKNLYVYDTTQVLLLSYLMLFYFFLDSALLLKFPEINPYPQTVVIHHMISALFLITGPLIQPEFGPILIKIAVIEPTTWLRFFRRLIKPRRYYLLDVLSYASVFGVRHLWSPYLAYELILRSHESMSMTLTAAGVVFMNCMYVLWSVKYTLKTFMDEMLPSKEKGIAHTH